MRIYRSCLLAALLLLTQAVSAQAFAQTAGDAESQKARIVSKLYQATYGAHLRCGATPEWATLGKTYERFRTTYPELIRLLDSSPHFPAAKQNFQDFLAANPTSKLSEKNLAQECQALESMLRMLLDAPGASEAVAGYVQQLKG